MTRTDSIQSAHGVSLDKAINVLILNHQGAQWIKGLEHDRLQASMDEFTKLLLKTSTRLNLRDDGLEVRHFWKPKHHKN